MALKTKAWMEQKFTKIFKPKRREEASRKNCKRQLNLLHQQNKKTASQQQKQ